MVGCRLKRAVRALGAGRLDAGLASGAGHGAQFAAGGAERCPFVPCLAGCAGIWPVHVRTGERPSPHDHCFPIFPGPGLMDILYLLIPLSVILVLMVLAGLWWAIYHGQFESVEQEGERIIRDD